MKHPFALFSIIGTSLRNTWRTLRGFTKDPYIDWVIVLIVLVCGFGVVVTYGFLRFQKTQNILSTDTKAGEATEKPYFKVEELEQAIKSIKAREALRTRIEAGEVIRKISF